MLLCVCDLAYILLSLICIRGVFDEGAYEGTGTVAGNVCTLTIFGIQGHKSLRTYVNAQGCSCTSAAVQENKLGKFLQ